MIDFEKTNLILADALIFVFLASLVTAVTIILLSFIGHCIDELVAWYRFRTWWWEKNKR